MVIGQPLLWFHVFQELQQQNFLSHPHARKNWYQSSNWRAINTFKTTFKGISKFYYSIFLLHRWTHHTLCFQLTLHFIGRSVLVTPNGKNDALFVWASYHVVCSEFFTHLVNYTNSTPKPGKAITLSQLSLWHMWYQSNSQQMHMLHSTVDR